MISTPERLKRTQRFSKISTTITFLSRYTNGKAYGSESDEYDSQGYDIEHHDDHHNGQPSEVGTYRSKYSQGPNSTLGRSRH